MVRRALKYLSDDPGFDVVGVVSPPGGLADAAGQLGLRALTHDEAHGRSWDGIDAGCLRSLPAHASVGDP